MQYLTTSALVTVWPFTEMIVGGVGRSEPFLKTELENVVYLWSLPHILDVVHSKSYCFWMLMRHLLETLQYQFFF